MNNFDEKTIAHINEVKEYLDDVISIIKDRAKNHDASKLKSPEREIFTKYSKACEYGSDEYTETLKKLDKALSHHYKVNRHHPEHFKRGFGELNLIDLLELLADWKSATNRYETDDILKSIDINQKRFKYDDNMKTLLKNTVRYLNWVKN